MRLNETISEAVLFRSIKEHASNPTNAEPKFTKVCIFTVRWQGHFARGERTIGEIRTFRDL